MTDDALTEAQARAAITALDRAREEVSRPKSR